MTAIKKKDGGVTLIELMIVLFIAGFLVAGIYSLFITQHRSYAVQDQVVGVQQDARAALDIMARDIRMAGFGAGAGSGTGFTDGSTSSITIPSNPPTGFSYYHAIEPINSTTGPDTLTVVFGAVALGTVSSVSGNSVTLTAAASTSTPVLFAFDLLPGRLYQGTVGGAMITIASTGFPSGSSTIVGGKACGVQAITYSVGTNGVLSRNTNTSASSNQPLAGDGISTFVEDLQFAYQVQGDTANWYNTAAAGGATNADIRMVRISLIVRTVIPDSRETGFSRPDCEDRTGDATNPGCRRRVYTTVVKVRNL